MHKAIASTGLAVFLAAAGINACAAAEAASNGCEYTAFQNGYYFVGNERKFDEETYFLDAHKLDIPLYKESSGDGRASPLVFGRKYGIIDPGQGIPRIKIKDLASGSLLGWVDRNEVFCRRLPLSDPRTGLYQRAVVRTEDEFQGQTQIKKIYPSLDHRCEGGGCLEVSRFQWYFIYAEEQDHYLISSDANLRSPTTKLLGWLPKKDAFNWNTAFGLRPAEELANVGPGQKEKFICAYKTREDLARGTNCNPILGGERWFDLSVRVAVLNQDNQAYEVIFSNAFEDPSRKPPKDVTPDIANLKNLDVYFVIDGTSSMQPAIEAVKTLTSRVREKLRAKLTQGVIRYGFQVYRDSGPAGDGIANSESLQLKPGECGKSNEEDFNAAFKNIKAVDSPGDDDFPENSFGGIAQASDGAAACPDQLKLIFVIGDHGYDYAKQEKRKNSKRYSEAQLIDRFRVGKGRFKNPPIVMFIQTPSEEAAMPTYQQVRYHYAYELFANQAKTVTKGIYAGTPINPSNFFYQMSSGNVTDVMAQQIVSRVEDVFQPLGWGEIVRSVEAGEPLEQAIKRLQGNNQLNIPIMFYQIVEAALCERLGPQCKKRVLEGVHTGYIKVTEPVVPEVLLSKENLEKWLKILNMFTTFADVPGLQKRQQLVRTLMADLGGLLAVDVENTRAGLNEMIQLRGGIPNGANSKLMQYSPEDLRDQAKVPSCELEYLAQYANKKHRILNYVYTSDGKLMARFRTDEAPQGQCQNMTDKGKRIPFIVGEPEAKQINRASAETNRKISHTRGGEIFFWVPIEYMP